MTYEVGIVYVPNNIRLGGEKGKVKYKDRINNLTSSQGEQTFNTNIDDMRA